MHVRVQRVCTVPRTDERTDTLAAGCYSPLPYLTFLAEQPHGEGCFDWGEDGEVGAGPTRVGVRICYGAGIRG